MSLLNVAGISKKEREQYLVKDINFVQEPSQKIAIAGGTGSGKTTLLKIIAGLIQPDAGDVWFEGIRVKGPLEQLLPGHPQIAYLSQDFELRNHYRVKEILEMANKLSHKDAFLVYEVCRIDHLLNRWSHELSGGERQRVAFAKVLVGAPKLFLLDEPFSNLDAIHRNILKSVINDIQERITTTCILVSHDPVDLFSWAEEIIVLNQGKVIQRATAEEVYLDPVNEYVAALFGKYNFISPQLLQTYPSLRNQGRRFIRPGEFRISSQNSNGAVKGKIKALQFLGSHYEVEVYVEANELIITSDKQYQNGEEVFVSLK